jgi:hypothetical protein
MKKNNVVFIVLFVLLAFFFIYNPFLKEKEIESIQLVRILTFPAEDSELYLANPVGFAFSDDYIFISDQQSSIIYQFNYQGEFLKEIGGPGSGPGELMMPGRIQYYGNSLFVNDIGNGRFTRLQLDGNQSYSFLPQEIPVEFIIGEESIFMTHLYITAKESLEKLPLIRNYDFELNERNSFGDHLNLVENMPPRASSLFLKIYNDHLYTLFENYPILHIYSIEGELKNTIQFDEFYRDKIQQNYQETTFANASVLNLRKLFSGFDITEDGLFFFVFDDADITIDHFDHEGVFQSRLTKENLKSDFFVRDMKVVTRNNRDLLFYLLNLENGFPKVDVFKWSRAELNDSE